MNRFPNPALALRRVVVLIIGLLLQLPAGAATSGEELWLVRCTVVDSKVDGNETISTHRIDHLYQGPAKKKGLWFYYRHNTRQGGLRGPVVSGQPPKLREEGIWALQVRDDDPQPISYFEWGLRFPQRKGVHEDYLEVVDLAAASEKYEAAPQDDRLDLLKEAALGTNPTLAYWGVSEMGRSKLKFSATTLDALIYDKTLLIAGQVALDEELTKLQGDFWRHSEHRLRMAKTWLKARLPPADETRVRNRLDAISGRPEREGFAPEEREAMTAAIRERFSKK